MTVRELIEMLSRVDPTLEVYATGSYSGSYAPMDIVHVTTEADGLGRNAKNPDQLVVLLETEW